MALEAAHKTLIRLLGDGEFHSGTELAEQLGISRAAIWKHIRSLERLGLELTAIPGRGYRLLSPVDWLDEARIREALGDCPTAFRLEIHDALDSTNSHLLRAARQGAETGSVCLAEYQQAGRGRIGRDWVSPFGANIYLSLLWRFEDPAQVGGLSLAVGVALLRALTALGISGLALKWPNDILVGRAKLGGILLDVAGEAHGGCAVVVGIGLNRYLPAAAAAGIDQAWTDLMRISGASPPRNALVARVLIELFRVLSAYAETGLSPYLAEWRAAHAFAGQAATLQLGEQCVAGTIVDISDEGFLLLRDQTGELRRFASGDVRLRVSAP